LLIGFWYQKAFGGCGGEEGFFLTTRGGGWCFFPGDCWCLRKPDRCCFMTTARDRLEPLAWVDCWCTTRMGLTAAGAIGWILRGAVGKSGQLTLHVWLRMRWKGLRRAALIHAAKRWWRRVFINGAPVSADEPECPQAEQLTALTVVTWVGGNRRRLFAALVAGGAERY